MNCRYLLPVVLLAAFVLPATASAQEPVPLDLSVGLKGGAMMQAVTEVPELTPQQVRQYQPQRDDLSGFFGGFGVGPGFGLSLEARAWEVVGLETGFFYSLDHATGWVDKSINGNDVGRVLSDQQTSALHIPLLLKANAKTEMVKPFFGLGFEFVLQQTSSLDYRSEPEDGQHPGNIEQFEEQYANRNTIEPSSYTLLQLTTGIELDLGEIRIPFEIRAGYNLGWDESFEARVDAEGQGDNTEFRYNGEYLAHFGVFVGVMYDWELEL